VLRQPIPARPKMSCVSKASVDDDDDKVSASLVCWNEGWQQPVTPCPELYDDTGYDRPPAVASRHRSLYTTLLTTPTNEIYRSTSRPLPDNFSIFVNPLLDSADDDPAKLAFDKIAPQAQHAIDLSKEGGRKRKKKRRQKDPNAHLSLQSLDNIHTVSILCWRRGRKAYLATSGAKETADESDDDEDDDWHITETVLFILYRAVGYFVLVAQFTFLWSLLDLYAADFADSESKRKPVPIKYTAGMTDLDFGPGSINVTIATWEAARPASNVRQCREWILECGARWALGEGCELEADIKSNCPPWDYEKHLQGRNGSQPICYRADGVAVLGGRPYYGSMTKGVLLEWAFGCVGPSGEMRVSAFSLRRVAPRFSCELLYTGRGTNELDQSPEMI
jgi:hypothetical protein